MRGSRHIQTAVACALALVSVACADASLPAGEDAPAPAPDVQVEIAEDVAPEVTPDGPDAAPEVVADIEVVEVEDSVETAEEVEVAPTPDVAPCDSGIDPEDPCWYCKCDDYGVRKCFPLGAGSSCSSDDCCMVNTTCQPCDAAPGQPCGEESGMACVGGPAIACDSEDPCTYSKLECVGGCQCTPIVEPNGTACVYDPDLCTEGDACLGGTCLPGEQVDMEDGNPCTTGMCIKGEVHQLPLSGPCTDDNACTVNDQCQAGVCTSGPPAVCLKGSCDATAVCDPGKGCVATPKPTGATCSPSGGDGCGICNAEGWCQTDGESCDDGNYCTNTVCLGNDDCIFVPNENECDDGDPCTYGDYCADGYCHSGSPLPCGDMNTCTDDECIGGACVNTPNTNVCNDGNECTENDTCQVALPPCPGPFGQPMVLHHVLIQGWLVHLRYSKVYPQCAQLRDLEGNAVGPPLCETGECVDVEVETSSFEANLGDNLKLCLENSGICTDALLVDQPSGEGFCAGVDVTNLLCDDGDNCTADSCNPSLGCVHTPIEPCGDLTLIYDDTQVTNDVEGDECSGEFVQIQCMPGSVAVGYSGKAGAALDEFRLRCRHLYEDGDLGLAALTAPLGAGLAGDAFGPLSCPGGAIMVGATVHAGTALHSVNGHCQEAEAVGLATPGFVAFAPQAGGAAGAAKAMDCPPGYAVTGMNGTLSDVACSIQLTCTRIEML